MVVSDRNNLVSQKGDPWLVKRTSCSLCELLSNTPFLWAVSGKNSLCFRTFNRVLNNKRRRVATT